MIQKGSNVLSEHKRHNLKFEPTLKQINFLDRRVYERSEGVYYPSVTTVLSYMPKNKFFENWLKDVGHNSDIIMRRAGDEGTQTHNAIEELLEGKEVQWMDDYGNAKYNETVWGMICKFKEFYDIAKPQTLLVEEFTYSDTHKYAGTADYVCKIGDENWLIDFKTSNSLHKSYELQLAAYAKSIEEVKGIKIDRTAILWLKSSTRGEDKSGKKIQGKGWELKVVDQIEENFELFKLIYKLYELENPATKPAYKTYPTSIKL